MLWLLSCVNTTMRPAWYELGRPVIRTCSISPADSCDFYCVLCIDMLPAEVFVFVSVFLAVISCSLLTRQWTCPPVTVQLTLLPHYKQYMNADGSVRPLCPQTKLQPIDWQHFRVGCSWHRQCCDQDHIWPSCGKLQEEEEESMWCITLASPGFGVGAQN